LVSALARTALPDLVDDLPRRGASIVIHAPNHVAGARGATGGDSANLFYSELNGDLCFLP